MTHLRQIRERYIWLETRRLGASLLFGDARALVRWADDSVKPDDQRLREYTEANFPIIRQSLVSAAAIYPELEKTVLSFELTKLREALGPDAPVVRKLFGARSPEALASSLVDGTQLGSAAVSPSAFGGWAFGDSRV